MKDKLPKSPPRCPHCGGIKKKKLKHILLEIVILATVVGFIPEFIVTGLSDIWGPCGFNADVCTQIQVQGAFKLCGAFVCSVTSVVLGFVVSKEFESSREK